MKWRKPQYIAGDHLVICDRCGFTIRKSQAKKTWDNLIVCPEDYEPRHPQDLVRAKADKQAVEDARPYPADRFLATNEVTADSL